jgi:hypothetical protein
MTKVGMGPLQALSGRLPLSQFDGLGRPVFTYLHVRKLDPVDWTDRYFEVREGRVSRMVTITADGTAESNSVAILAHRSGAYADTVRGDEGPCIVGGFPSPTDYEVYWAKQGCTFEAITAKEFQRRFMRARPDL